MSRRVWFVVAVVAAMLAFAATAGARPVHRLGGLRHGAKPTRKHLIAVRHGRHIVWLSRTHGLAKHRLPTIKLSPDVRLSHGVREFSTFGPTSTPAVTKVGSCTLPTQSSPDGMDYVQSYGNLFADVLNCVGNTGGNTESNAFFPYPTCTNNFPQSVHSSPAIYATFMDGEAMLLCTVPDDNGSGGSQANSGAPYHVYQQGFGCQAAIGVGSDDNTPYIAKGNDSLEYSQTYTENGQSVTAVTSSCIGRVPNSVTIDTSAPVYHLVSCTQYDPNAPGKVVRALGETITYPDGQYQETCNDPAYQTSVVCVTSTPCSTDVSADATSELKITETPATPGTLTEGVDQGNPLSCAARQYGGYPDLGPNWYSFSFTGTGSKQLTYDLFFLPFNPSNNVQICFGATVPFQANGDASSQPGTLPDGTPGQIGLLPSCDSISSSGPCVSRVGPINSDIPREGTRVLVLIPQSYTGDPWMGRG